MWRRGTFRLFTAPPLVDHVAMRRHLVEKGWVVVPDVVSPAAIVNLRTAVRKGVTERSEHLLKMPRAIDIFRQQRDEADADPTYSKFVKKFKEVMKKKRAAKRKQRAIRKAQREGKPVPERYASVASSTSPESTSSTKKRHLPVAEASKDDVWELSQRIAQQLVSVPPQRSSVYNDPARLAAINAHRCNVWMTSGRVKDAIHGDLGQAVGAAARDIAGVEDPVLFADRPFLRESFCRPTLLHCAAPLMGVEDTPVAAVGGDAAGATACMAWVMLDDCGGLQSEVQVMSGSHTEVRSRLHQGVREGGVDPRRLHVEFIAVDSDISLWLQKFPELMERPTEAVQLPKGSVLLCDPCTMVSMGPNFSRHAHVSLQCLVASKRHAKPTVHRSSWIREWKSQSKSVDLGDPVIFPPLTADSP